MYWRRRHGSLRCVGQERALKEKKSVGQERALKEALRKRHEISVTQLAGAAAERENLIRAVKKLQVLPNKHSVGLPNKYSVDFKQT